MSIFSFMKPKVLTTLQEQGGSAIADAKKTARYVFEHAGSLLALLRLELGEYAGQQKARLSLLAAACFFFFFSYLAACVFVCLLLQMLLGSWLWSVGLVCLFNVVMGGVFMLAVWSRKPAAVAPVTRQELQKDWECLNILLNKEKTNS